MYPITTPTKNNPVGVVFAMFKITHAECFSVVQQPLFILFAQFITSFLCKYTNLLQCSK